MSNTSEAATEQSAQDVTARIESALYGSEEPETTTEDEVATGDAEELSTDADTESDDKEDGSDDELETQEDEQEEEQEATLATYLGVDEDRIIVDDDGSVSLTTIVDGEKKNVPLSELTKSFQLQGHVNNKSMALEKERKEFGEQKQQVLQELKQRSEGVASLGKVLENQLLQEYNSVDWEGLRVSNPAEWTAQRQEYADKAQQIQQAQLLMKQDFDRSSQEAQQQMEGQRQQHLQAEMAKVIEANPEWADEGKRSIAITGLRSTLTGYGFEESDMSNIMDHRIIQVLKDAKAYRDGKTAAETKKVRNVPKFQKPTATKATTQKMANARAIKAKRAAVKRTGSIADAASLLLDKM